MYTTYKKKEKKNGKIKIKTNDDKNIKITVLQYKIVTPKRHCFDDA